jgi:hypothetical protein
MRAKCCVTKVRDEVRILLSSRSGSSGSGRCKLEEQAKEREEEEEEEDEGRKEERKGRGSGYRCEHFLGQLLMREFVKTKTEN